MTTYRRICIEDYTIRDSVGNEMTLHRGKEYLTSDVKDGKVCVFSTYWVWIPVDLFAGEIKFT